MNSMVIFNSYVKLPEGICFNWFKDMLEYSRHYRKMVQTEVKTQQIKVLKYPANPVVVVGSSS